MTQVAGGSRTRYPANRTAVPITADEVRAALFGRYVDGVQVVRQAWRTTEDDSDELVLLDGRGSWWVARRISDQVTVWAYAGDIEAEDGFEQLVDAARHSDHAWHEARAAMLDGGDRR